MGRKRYDEEFKREAVRMVLEGGVSASQVARDLGVSETGLSKWLSASRDAKSSGVTESEREELKRLRKENAVLRTERDILKKAATYFARSQG